MPWRKAPPGLRLSLRRAEALPSAEAATYELRFNGANRGFSDWKSPERYPFLEVADFDGYTSPSLFACTGGSF